MDSPERPDQNSSTCIPSSAIKIVREHPITLLLLYALVFLFSLFTYFLCKALYSIPIVIVMMFVVSVISWRKGRNEQPPANESDGQNSRPNRIAGFDELDGNFLANVIGLPTIFSFEAMEIATDRFSNEIGRGGFGKVYKGILTDGTVVAVKCLHDQACQGQREFYTEVTTISSLNHSNLVSLRGVCVEGLHRILVYELMANGSLDKWLFGSDRVLDWKTRYSIALDTARGLAYLHDESRLCILHLDIKPQNILLDEDFRAKVSDFGLARSLNRDMESRVVTGVRGTPGYMAPEWLWETGITSKSDVFSYGMVLLEIVRGRKNVDNSRDSENWYFPSIAFGKARQGKMDELIDSELKLNSQQDMEEVCRVIKTALWCIQSNRALRPSMGTVVRILEGDLEILEPPLDCKLPFAPSFDKKTQRDTCVDLETVDQPLEPEILLAPSIDSKTETDSSVDLEVLVFMDDKIERMQAASEF